MPLAPGSTVGRYQIRSRLGGGAMGEVWLAHDPALERRVALKLIAPALAGDDDFRARFLREARAAAAIDHPHVLPVYEAGEAEGQLFLAMRYVPGVDLATRLARDGPFELDASLTLVGQLAAALDAAHAAGVIHRDLKPANVLLAAEGHAYLADFGLARSAAGAGLTRPGQLIGTAAYTAPELLRGQPASPASDTYALACLTVECLTGQPPFAAGDELATLYAHAHDAVPTLTERQADLPAGLQAVIERGLAKEPAQRYSSAGALAAALVAAVAHEAYEPAPPNGARRGMRLSLMRAAVVGLAVGVGGAVALFWPDLLQPHDQAPATTVTSGLAPGTTIPAGTYRPQFSPPFTFDADAGWRLLSDEPDIFSMWRDIEQQSGELTVVRLQTVYRDQCRASGTERIDADVDSVIQWLEQHPHLEMVADPYPITVGAVSGLEFGMRVPDLEPCPDDPFPGVGAQTYLFPTTREPFTVPEEQEFLVRVVEVRGSTVTVWLRGEPDFLSRAGGFLDSVQLTPADGGG